MMHLTAIAEQFSKLKDKTIIAQFDSNDIKGAVDFIAYDYDGVNLCFNRRCYQRKISDSERCDIKDFRRRKEEIIFDNIWVTMFR